MGSMCEPFRRILLHRLMVDALKSLVLAVCKVPPEPEPPAGSPGSVRVFRAARSFYTLSLIKWGLAQTGALIGIFAVLGFDFGQHILPSRAWLSNVFRVVEMFALAGLFAQMPFSYFLVRLDFEMRWYLVTDRSLRIRHGVVSVRELTMTFANIQQMTIRQGPLQRLLGIADLQVQTAGGGSPGGGESGGTRGHGAAESMHVGYFHGVDNAQTIRDLIFERLRQHRDAGLGDPDDVARENPAPLQADSDVVEAARSMLAEARALRKALARFAHNPQP
ncbi:MAG: PH domain-containing protein [Verrucomicrobia bacterium]|nr:PH domain-containing protein [Verrucomicrobiota bacterium]